MDGRWMRAATLRVSYRHLEHDCEGSKSEISCFESCPHKKKIVPEITHV